MFYINKTYTYKFVIKHSQFIALAYPLNNIDDLKIIIKQIKKDYPKANHYPYAYKVENEQGQSDDGEPAQSSGKVIMDVLTNNNFTNLVIFIPRYFGGIKLGKSVLTRTYYNCAQEVSKLFLLYTKELRYIYRVVINYDKQDEFIRLFKPYITKEIYFELIEYELALPNKELITKYNYLFKEVNFIKEESILIERNNDE